MLSGFGSYHEPTFLTISHSLLLSEVFYINSGCTTTTSQHSMAPTCRIICDYVSGLYLSTAAMLYLPT